MRGDAIGAFRNEWRGRHVVIFEDIDDPAMVYTEGHEIPMRGMPAEPLDEGRIISTHEPKLLFEPWIGRFNGVYH